MRTILIPMAGRGQRFVDAGYDTPKPFIDILGKPMIEWVIDSIRMPAHYIYCVLEEHLEKYNVKKLFDRITPYHTIVPVKEVTGGAVCTCLLAEKYIDYKDQLIIANSDQIVTFDRMEFNRQLKNFDGCTVVFEATDPKWSFVSVAKSGFVSRVVEKEPISNTANVGIYGWRKADYFFWSAQVMMERKEKVNNEYYIAPTYNVLINTFHNITALGAEAMLPCGTPEDLQNTIHLLESQK